MEDMRRQEVRELARLTAPLTAAQQGFFQGEYGRHRRSPTTALMLCLLLGGFGAHYFYFGRHRAGLLRLLLSWTLVPAVAALFEARTIAVRAMRYNASLANELLLAMRDMVHEQPREVAALESLSTPMALPVRHRAALNAPDEHDVAADGAEAALIAAAYAGRESARGMAIDGVANGHGALAAYDIGSHANGADAGGREDAHDTAAHPQMPASEYDTWYDEALHAAPRAETNAHANGALAAETGPDAPQWVPLPEWPAPVTQPRRAEPVEDWAMPDLGQQDAPAFPAHPQIAAADLLEGASFDLLPDSAGEHAGRPDAGIAAAATGAAAAWAAYEQHNAGQASEPAARSEREPVFSYQAAPVARRPSVHYGPPEAGPAGGAWEQNGPAEPSLPRRIGEDVGLASLGSLLASGLADLLRERPAPLRTRPLTQPHEAQSDTARASSAHLLEPITTPPQRSSVEQEDPWAVSASIRAPLAESPHLAPADEEPAFTTEAGAPADHRLAFGVAAAAAGGAALTAEQLWAHDGAHQAPSELVAEPYAAPAEPEAWAPSSVVDLESVPVWQPAPMEPAVDAPPAYVSTPSESLRRRITHRLFVRKMAVLDGRVVAESSAERQVELIDDDAIMAERVRLATQSAAREALENLLQLAPAEALPAVRAQLLSLDLDAS